MTHYLADIQDALDGSDSSQINRRLNYTVAQFVDAKRSKNLSHSQKQNLVACIVSRILAGNDVKARKTIAEKIVKRLSFSSLRAILQKLLELCCVGVSLYVTRLYYQLAIAAAEKFGQQFGLTSLESNAYLHAVVGIGTFIALTTVYTRCCYDTAIAEYTAFKRCYSGAKPTLKGVLARLSAIIPAFSIAILAYPENGLGYSIAVGVALSALLGVGMKALFNLSAKKALLMLLIGSSGLGYFASPFGLKPFADPVHNLILDIPLGIGTGLAFAAFAGNGAIELWTRFRADFNNRRNNFSLNVLKAIKWTVLTLIGLAAGFATSEVWAKTMTLFGCDNCVAVPITMIFGMFAGCLFNESSMDKFLVGAFAYVKNTFWTMPKTMLENISYRCQGLSAAERIDEILKQITSAPTSLHTIDQHNQAPI